MYHMPSTMKKFVTVVFVTVLPLLKASQKDWIPIFVAFSGNGKSVGDAWFSGTGTSPRVDLSYDNRSYHYRSPIIDYWSKHKISKIKMELHRKECMVAWMIFDGKGTTNENWYDRDRLLHSSFDDKSEVKEFPNFFITSSKYYDPFVITKWASTCEEESGVFIVVDEECHCPWCEHDRYPLLLLKNETP